MQAMKKMNINLCWPNPSHASEEIKCISNYVDTKFISTCVDQTPPMPARPLNVSQHVLTKPLPCYQGHKCISPCVEQTPPMRARTQPPPYQRGNQIYLNMWCPILYHASEDTKYISTCVHQTPEMPWISSCISRCVNLTHLMPMRTPNTSQHVLIKPLPCQREHKTYRNMCCPNTFLANVDTKFISICVDHPHHIPAGKQNVCQHVLAKPLQRQGRQKMHLNICWPNPYHASEDTN